MSKEVDERVVSMEFDNKNFEANVRASMSTIEKLKNALTFKGASKGLQAVEKASSKINFNGLNSAVDQIGVRFSSMQVIATTALANITNAAVNAGKQMLNSFTLQPITSGFQEYETQIGSIQTILSNTRWQNTSLDQVNGALDQLNDYADQTIYNFTEMTRNIGTFTAAGVGLDQSVAAIKGIANLAAVSGSSSQQASTAMYQLSQALAAGRVSLMDWNSVVNAGMGGKVFQDALIRTSELMGTGAKQAIETYGTFRESLTQGQWLTTDVLTETLKQISGAYSEADLISQGYTQEQAAEIVALADDATNAATKVRTFTQLMDTTMEALGSGWTNTWEILIGDFDEATEFWSGISSVINEAVGQSADARNQMLQEWVDLGGRQNILDGLTLALEGLGEILTPIKEAFSEIFPPMTAQTLLDFSTGFKNLMNDFKTFAAGAAPVVKDVFTAIFSVLKAIGSVIGSAASGIGEFFGVISSSGGNIGEIISKLAGFVTGAANAVTESGALTGVLVTLGNAFGNVLGAITSLITGGVSKLGNMFSGVGDILSGAADIIVTAISNITSGLGDILGTADFGSLIDVFNSGMLASLIVAVKGWFKSLTGGVEDSTGGLIDSLKEMVSGISDTASSTLDAVRGSLETWQTNIKTDILLKIAVAVVALVAAIAVLAAIDPDRLTDALGAITVLFAELIGSMTLFTKLNTSMDQLSGVATMIAMAAAIAILAGAMKSISDLDMDQITRGTVGIAALATIMVALTKALSKGGNISKGAVQLVIMAAAIKLLASVVTDLSVLDWEGLAKGLVGVGALMVEVSAFSRMVKSDELLRTAASMAIMGGALEILVDVVRDFGAMPLEQIITGLVTVAAAMVEFAVLMRTFPKGTTIIKSAAGIFVLALALEALVPAMQGFSGLGIEGAAIGIAAIAGVLGAMSGLMAIMSKMDVFRLSAATGAIDQMSNVFNNLANSINTMSQISVGGIVQSLVALTTGIGLMIGIMLIMSTLDVGDVASITITMPVLAASMGMLADAINKIGNMSLENAAAATISLVGAIGALALGMEAVKGKLSSVAALMIVSVALVALAGAIVLISNSGIIGVATSFIALAGAMTIVGVATRILKPLIPSMFNLAISIATFGASLIALGIGTAAVGVGLGLMITSLAAGLVALAAIDIVKAGQGLAILAGAFVTIGVAAKLLKPLIPSILSLSASLISFSVAAAAVSISIAVLVSALTALGSIGQEGAVTVVSTLKELILGITSMIPELIGNLMESFKTIILGLLDALVEIAPQLADGIFQILSQTIQSSLEYMPEIAGFFIDFLIQMLNTVRERLPELFPAVTGLIGDLIKMIMEALGQWTETGNSIEMAVGIFTSMIGLVVLLNYIKSMIPGAMVGLAELAAFVLEFGVILTALGALQQLTGAASFINSAGDLLQSMGTAIGQFIGGLVGGVAEGATSTLPQVGTNLSEFGANVMPFLVAMKMVDQSTIDGVTNLALAIAALSGANFADAVTTFLSGGQDFGDLGAKLIPFGEAMVQFSNVVSGIDVAAVNASAACGQALAALASSLPKEGGLAQAIFGETVDIGTFATQIVAFGMAIKMYSMAVAGIDVNSIVASAQAGQALSDLASTLPKDGGLAQAIFGETTDMDAFGAQIVSFGLALKLYALAVAGLDVTSIQTSVQAGQALSDLANALPDEGGLAQWIFGGSDLGTFGQTLVNFGQALVDYATKLQEVDFATIMTATNNVNNIRNAISQAIGMDMSGLENLKRIPELSQALIDYSNDAASIDVASIMNSLSSLRNIKAFLSELSGVDFSGATAFVQSVNDITSIAMNGITGTIDVNSLSATGQQLMTSFAGGLRLGLGECTSAAREVIQGVCNELGNPTMVDIPGAGTSIVNKFAEGIKSNVGTATGAIGEIMTAAVSALNGYEGFFYAAGSNLAVGFANGISASSYRATLAARAMANAAKTAAESALQEHSPSKVMQRIGEFAGAGFVIGIENYVDASADVGGTMAEAAISAASSATKMFSTFGDLDAMVANLRDLSEALDTSKKDGEASNKETEEATENQSKLSEALSSVADSVDELIERKNDLSSLSDILNRTGVAFSDGFIAELMSSGGQYAGALDEMVNLTDEQLQTLNDIYDKTEAVETMEDMFQTMSESIDNLNKRRKNLKAMSSLLTRTGVSFSDNFVKEIMSSSGDYADSLYTMTDLTDEELQKISDIYEENSLFDQIQTVIDALVEDDGLAEAFTYSGKSIQGFVEDVNDFGISIDDAIDKMSEFADSVSDGFSKMELDGQTTLEEFTQNLENNWMVAKEWEANVNKVFSQISWSPLSEDFRKAVLEGGFEQWGQIMADLANSSQEEIYGFLQLWDYMQREGAKMSSNVANSLVSGDFEKSGTQIAQGVAKGVENGISNVTSAATLMCTNTEDTVKNYFGIHSPSTLMYQIGEYMVQGLVNGIMASATELDKAFTLVNQAIGFLQQLGDEGIEIQVRVTPVIDTTDFATKLASAQASMGVDTGSLLSNSTLNTIDRVASQFGQNGSKNVGSELVGAVSKLSDKIDSIDPSNFGVTYQQNNYSPKALSTGEIYRKTKSYISRYRSKNTNGGNLLK